MKQKEVIKSVKSRPDGIILYSLPSECGAVASGGGKGAAVPPPQPVVPDKSSLWMDWFFFDQSYFHYSDSQLFAIFILEVDFSVTSHDKCRK